MDFCILLLMGWDREGGVGFLFFILDVFFGGGVKRGRVGGVHRFWIWSDAFCTVIMA